jgi:hypothetical protein
VTTTNWFVKPEPLDPQTVEGVGPPEMGYWGCLGPAVAGALILLMSLLPNVKFSWFLLLPAAIVVSALMYLDYRMSGVSLAAAFQKRVTQKRDSLEREAKQNTDTLRLALERNRGSIQKINSHLKRADSLLDVAEKEFDSRAFGPFWDAIEQAAVEVGQYRDGLDDLAKEAEWYQERLRGKDHTFPGWQQAMVPIGSPDGILARFRAVVRSGQTDFEFANIFEHRRTRQVLIAGFEHLGDALINLADSVEARLVLFERRLTQLVRQIE